MVNFLSPSPPSINSPNFYIRIYFLSGFIFYPDLVSIRIYFISGFILYPDLFSIRIYFLSGFILYPDLYYIRIQIFKKLNPDLFKIRIHPDINIYPDSTTISSTIHQEFIFITLIIMLIIIFNFF